MAAHGGLPREPGRRHLRGCPRPCTSTARARSSAARSCPTRSTASSSRSTRSRCKTSSATRARRRAGRSPTSSRPRRRRRVLREIRVQVGRTGVLTPLAVFDPVTVAGLDDRARHAAQRGRGRAQGRARRRHDRRAQGRRRDPRGRGPGRSGCATAPSRVAMPHRVPVLRRAGVARAGRGRGALHERRAVPRSAGAPRALGEPRRADIEGLGEEIIARLVETGCVHDVADFYALDAPSSSPALDMGRVQAGRLGGRARRRWSPPS